MNFLTNNKILILFFLLIFAFSLGSLAHRYLPSFPQADLQGYDEVAIELSDNFNYRLTSSGHILAPGYPIFLALIFKTLGHNLNMIYNLQFLLLGLIGYIIFLIANDHLNFPKLLSSSTAVATITWPYLLLYSNLILSEILYIFIFVLGIYFYLTILEHKNKRLLHLIAISFLFATATLTRAVALLLPAWLAIIFWLSNIFLKQHMFKSSIIKKIFIICILYFLFITPWIIFASYKANKFVPIVSYGSTMTKRANTTYVNNLFQPESNKKVQNLNLDNIIILKIKNIYRFWKSGASGTQADQLIKTRPKTKYLIWAYRIYYYFILTFFFFSLIFIKNKKVFLLWAIVVYFWLLHTLIYPYPRYTLPLIPIVILLATYSINNLYQKKFKILKQSNRRPKSQIN